MRIPAIRLAVAALAIAALGCDSPQHPSAGGTDGSVYLGTGSSADFATGYIAAFCQFFTRCGESRSVDDCRKEYFDTDVMDLTAILRGIDDGRVLYNKSNAGACFEALANATCIGGSTSDGSQAAANCVNVLTGTVSSGGPCVSDVECSTGSCNQLSCVGACCLGVCAQRSAIGQACTSSADCAVEASCQFGSSAQGTCQARVAQGQPCTDSSGCQNGLGCDSGGSKTCVPPIKDGQACTPDGVSCATLSSYCDPTSGTCMPRLAIGASCTLLGGSTSSRSSNCVMYAECRGGTCAALPSVGESCAVPDGAYATSVCLLATCTGGTCQVPARKPCTIETAQVADAGPRD
jgi:hypothetical protein